MSKINKLARASAIRSSEISFLCPEWTDIDFIIRLIFKNLISLCLVVSMAALGCSGSKEWDRQESALKSLIKRQATKEDVIAALGSNYNDCSRGSTNREALLSFLRNEPQNRLVEVRAKIDKWPNVLFYSTPDVMTWVFLNSSNCVVDYALSAQ